MQFLCLLYGSEAAEPEPGTPEFDAMMEGFEAFSATVVKDGKFVSGDALQPVATSTTVAVRDGKTHVTDGPFAETKEQLGGYYLLECTDLDEALKYAAMIPSATWGRVEVRPVMVFD